MPPAAPPEWPYPRWIAHRGAGKLAPENTLAAFRLGASHGYRMFECDAKLSADGVVFLLHDDTLERTTNGHGLAGKQPWSALCELDAGAWHSSPCAGEPLSTLAAVARYCLANRLCLNIEIKPTPGLEAATGRAVALAAAELWRQAAPGTPAPVLTSFQVASLTSAKEAVPHLPRGLLLNTLWADWLEAARELHCQAIVCHHPLWQNKSMAQAKKAGFRTLAYTVNEATEAQRLWDLGADGLITDRIDDFDPSR